VKTVSKYQKKSIIFMMDEKNIQENKKRCNKGESKILAIFSEEIPLKITIKKNIIHY
jgi:hypothetical protein